MRPKFWMCDEIQMELEERDVKVTFVNSRTLVAITVAFRLSEAASDTSFETLKRRCRHLAGDSILDLAAFLDRP